MVIANRNLAVSFQLLACDPDAPRVGYALDMGDMPTSIGPYRIIRVLGEGDTGIVYEGRRTGGEPGVAIKILRPANERRELTGRFAHEARIASLVSHPGVVKFVEFVANPDSEPYLVLELLTGETLGHRLRRSPGEPLPVPLVLELMRQTASALAALHSQGIVHRDVEPDNLMLVPDPDLPGPVEGVDGERVKLLDFSIAKLKPRIELRGDPELTPRGVPMGTPIYMSPEHFRGAREADLEADVYSLGIVCYQLLTGRPPFTAPTPAELWSQHLLKSPPALKSPSVTLPPALCTLVHRMLAKSPRERPGMEEVGMELGRIAAEERAVMRQLAKMGQLPASQAGAAMVDEAKERARAAVKKERAPAPVSPVELLPSQTSSRARHGLMLGIGVVALFVYAMVGGFFIYRIMTQP